MIRKWWDRLRWYIRNFDEIDRLDRARREWIHYSRGHLYCTEHRRFGCGHSTWRKEQLAIDTKKANDWYRAELAKLP